MGNSFYERMVQSSVDSSYNFPKLSLFALLRELARDKVDLISFFERMNIDSNDENALSYISYILSGSTISERLDRVQILQDIALINEGGGQEKCDFNSFYPNEEALRHRIGI